MATIGPKRAQIALLTQRSVTIWANIEQKTSKCPAGLWNKHLFLSSATFLPAEFRVVLFRTLTEAPICRHHIPIPIDKEKWEEKVSFTRGHRRVLRRRCHTSYKRKAPSSKDNRNPFFNCFGGISSWREWRRKQARASSAVRCRSFYPSVCVKIRLDTERKPTWWNCREQDSREGGKKAYFSAAVWGFFREAIRLKGTHGKGRCFVRWKSRTEKTFLIYKCDLTYEEIK